MTSSDASGEPSGAPLPEGLAITIDDTSVSLTWRDASWSNAFAFVALIAANTFAVSWLVRGGAGSSAGVLIAATAIATYAVLVKLVNRKTVHANRERLRISSSPLPWWGGETIAAADLREIRCDEKPLAFRHAGRVGLTAMSTRGPIALAEISDEFAPAATNLCTALSDILGIRTGL